ncbi:MAG: bifunctional oligoribonuclease/PAP phosphatase NrnA [Tannerellaceae bacterium]|nr:bifunctional oligoribonuclease/PAP phosphatase NrnA [Tannerellaceae bacterium]
MLSKILREDDVRKAKKYIEKGESFAIVIHSAPDGDALGSSLGLFHFLESLGKDKVSIIAPNDYPPCYKWMAGVRDIVIHDRYPDFAEHLIRTADVIFCLDFNEPRRTGRLASTLVAAEGRRVMIDHHLHPEDFCRVVISHPEISSTSEMIFRFICRLGMYDLINKQGAEAIYTGMMTDTGAFTFGSNHPEIYTIIENLLRKGIDKDLIYRRVYQNYSDSRMRMMGYVLHDRMKIYPKKQTALLTLSQSELRRFKYATGDTEGFVNLPLNIEGIIFSAFIREDPETVKVSLRSTGDFPCNEFALAFGGGGHKNAAGGEFHGTLLDAIALFEQTLENFSFKFA